MKNPEKVARIVVETLLDPIKNSDEFPDDMVTRLEAAMYKAAFTAIVVDRMSER